MNQDKLENIKKLAIMAMFANDILMENLVLKGGNALDIIYRVANRASLDLDFSIPDDINISSLSGNIKANLTEIFKRHGYYVFDIRIQKRPRITRPFTPNVWGGYSITFKIADIELYEKLQKDMNALRKQSIEVGKKNSKSFSIEISKYEYCETKVEREVDGLTIYVYSPEMILFEKLRAICQQMPGYSLQLNPRPRAKDFFDIYTVASDFNLDLFSKENLKLLENIFAAKKVSLKLMLDISKYEEFHKHDFASVEDTVKPGTDLKSYDFYFEYVLKLSHKLCQALGVK